MVIAPAPGEEFARCRLGEVIGYGGMGMVFAGRDLASGADVAVKVIRGDRTESSESRARFRREVRLIEQVRHPHILPVHRSGEERHQPFLVTPLMPDGSLRDLLRDCGRLTVPRVLSVLAQVAAALDAAHDRGIVHRDVKPSNILVDRGHGHLYLADFGIARAVDGDDGLTSTGAHLGTLAYAAPEQLRGGPVDERADVYSLACVTYEMLVGTPPFGGDGANAIAVMEAHASGATADLGRLPDLLPDRLTEVLGHALSADIDRRPRAATAFAAAMQKASGLPPEMPVLAPGTPRQWPTTARWGGRTRSVPSHPSSRGGWSHRRWIMGIAAMASGVLAAGAGSHVIFGGAPEPGDAQFLRREVASHASWVDALARADAAGSTGARRTKVRRVVGDWRAFLTDERSRATLLAPGYRRTAILRLLDVDRAYAGAVLAATSRTSSSETNLRLAVVYKRSGEVAAIARTIKPALPAGILPPAEIPPLLCLTDTASLPSAGVVSLETRVDDAGRRLTATALFERAGKRHVTFWFYSPRNARPYPVSFAGSGRFSAFLTFNQPLPVGRWRLVVTEAGRTVATRRISVGAKG